METVIRIEKIKCTVILVTVINNVFNHSSFFFNRLQNHGMSTEEMMEIMSAIGDDEDLEVQRALTEGFGRNQNN